MKALLQRSTTHIAVLALGGMRSKKALPILLNYYKNDPEGFTCKGRHEEAVCRYELYKALNRIKGRK
jgi:HEAT repeat protein